MFASWRGRAGGGSRINGRRAQHVGVGLAAVSVVLGLTATQATAAQGG
jgi:hypothetical protein